MMLTNSAVVDMYETAMTGVKGYHDAVLKHVSIEGKAIMPPPVLTLNVNNVSKCEQALLDSYRNSDAPDNPCQVLKRSADWSILHDATTKYTRNLNSCFIRVVDESANIVKVPFSLTEVPGGSVNTVTLSTMLLQEMVKAKAEPKSESAFHQIIPTLQNLEKERVENEARLEEVTATEDSDSDVVMENLDNHDEETTLPSPQLSSTCASW